MYSHHSTSAVEQVAVEAAPKLLDPIQQTIATILRSYINSPTISRKEIMGALQLLTEPQPGVYIKELRKAYETFLANNQIEALIAAVENIAIDTATTSRAVSMAIRRTKPLSNAKIYASSASIMSWDEAINELAT